MYKLIRRRTTYPPHLSIPEMANPWIVISEFETLEEIKQEFEEVFPTQMFVYGVLDKDNKLILED